LNFKFQISDFPICNPCLRQVQFAINDFEIVYSVRRDRPSRPPLDGIRSHLKGFDEIPQDDFERKTDTFIFVIIQFRLLFQSL